MPQRTKEEINPTFFSYLLAIRYVKSTVNNPEKALTNRACQKPAPNMEKEIKLKIVNKGDTAIS